MFFCTDEAIKKEFNSIALEKKSLESEYYNLIGEVIERNPYDEEVKDRIYSGLMALYDKEKILLERLSDVLKSIDDRWLSSPDGQESLDMTLLFNEALDKLESAKDQAYQIRRTLNNLS